MVRGVGGQRGQGRAGRRPGAVTGGVGGVVGCRGRIGSVLKLTSGGVRSEDGGPAGAVSARGRQVVIFSASPALHTSPGSPGGRSEVLR